MDDLISRSALLKSLTDWKFQECPVGVCDEETETYKTICECIEAVKEQPTAFDVNKVNIAIFEQSENIYGEIGKRFGITQMGVVGTYIKTSRAMDIVKVGGVNE